jgi:hypothetical protein
MPSRLSFVHWRRHRTAYSYSSRGVNLVPIPQLWPPITHSNLAPLLSRDCTDKASVGRGVQSKVADRMLCFRSQEPLQPSIRSGGWWDFDITSTLPWRVPREPSEHLFRFWRCSRPRDARTTVRTRSQVCNPSCGRVANLFEQGKIPNGSERLCGDQR